jgi:phenylacetate-CoA ligase
MGDRVLRLTAFAHTRQPLFMRLGLLRELQMESGSPPSLVLERWRAGDCSILQGYPSALRSLAQYCLASNEELSPTPREIFTDSELLGADTRRMLETVFHTRVTDVFGSYETDNIAYQCELGRGYHVTTDTVIVEILRDGQVVQHGEEGELVVTVLDNFRSPFIRYNLHDRVSWAGQPCDCGRSFPLLQVIKGRSDHLLLLPDGTERSAMDVLGRLDGFTEVMTHYQLRQHSARRYSLLYVPTPAWIPTHEQLLLDTIRPSLGTAEISLRRVTEIPLTASKKWLAFVREPDDGIAP